MSGRYIAVPRVWRSEAISLLVFLVVSPISVYLSVQFPASVIRGPLFSIGDSTIFLKLPLFWTIPAFILARAIIRIYDVKYTIDQQGLESKIGILSLSQTITRIRYEDIRSIDSRQTLTERILNVGTVELGTAASSGLEMVFTGIANPLQVQRLIQAERDARIKKANRGNRNSTEFQKTVAAGGE